jgi:hypothetical protein
MRGDFYKQLNSDLDTARAEGLFKEERIITSAAGGHHRRRWQPCDQLLCEQLFRSCESP